MLAVNFAARSSPLVTGDQDSVLVEKTAPAFNMKAGEPEHRGKRREIRTVHGAYDTISGPLQLGVCGAECPDAPLFDGGKKMHRRWSARILVCVVGAVASILAGTPVGPPTRRKPGHNGAGRLGMASSGERLGRRAWRTSTSSWLGMWTLVPAIPGRLWRPIGSSWPRPRTRSWRSSGRWTARPVAQLWAAEWPGAMSVPFMAKRNGDWIRSTPAYDGQSVYVAGMRDVLVCLDAGTGAERWRVDFVEQFKSPLPAFGFVCSPLVVGDHVFVQAAAGFCKLDKRTGQVVWRILEDGGGMFGSAFSSPVLATVCGQEQLLVQTRTETGRGRSGVRPDPLVAGHPGDARHEHPHADRAGRHHLHQRLRRRQPTAADQASSRRIPGRDRLENLAAGIHVDAGGHRRLSPTCICAISGSPAWT